MYLRIFSLGFCLALAACGEASAPPPGESIACAIGEGAEFAEVCTLEVAEGATFVIHHPDGEFRRFTRTDGPDMLAPADGAEPMSEVSLEGLAGRIEVSVGGDTYRFNREKIVSRDGE